MIRRPIRLLAAGVATLALAVTAASAWAAPAPKGPDLKPSTKVAMAKQTRGITAAKAAALASYKPTDNFTATWKRADALKVAGDATNTTPIIPPDFPVISQDVWQWDTWPLTNIDTKPITYKGWHVIMSLVAPRDIPFGDRHWVARIGYYYSKDGHNWIYGGHLIPEARGIGCMEWAGTAIMTGKNTVRQFYTTVGHQRGGPTCRTSPPYDTMQRLAVTQGQIHADSKGVWFTGFTKHTVIAQPDGKYYQTQDQGIPPTDYAFRDPFIFRNPKDKKIYAVWEGNTGGLTGTYQCTKRDLGNLPPGHTVDPISANYTGNIGLMKATNKSLTTWKLLSPLLSANCVNRQTERPHVVFSKGLTYLFTISHKFTYAPGVTGPDGVYGFVGPSLRSDYRPMNGSGLVLGNPPEAPEQNYSHEVLPNLMVQSFIDQVPTGNGNKPGGTLAPTLQLAFDGANSYLTRVLPYGYIPAMAGN
ncbi:MAG TPA: glycoside hydrolase family 68 protein [Microlunatus sp.]|nr:glycoside hydrolase family 68 protein [Microlunatus sp.]